MSSIKIVGIKILNFENICETVQQLATNVDSTHILQDLIQVDRYLCQFIYYNYLIVGVPKNYLELLNHSDQYLLEQLKITLPSFLLTTDTIYLIGFNGDYNRIALRTYHHFSNQSTCHASYDRTLSEEDILAMVPIVLEYKEG